ncbi:MAG: hypothetical protein WAV00_19415, partial [Nocardioides sp.]
EDVDEAAEEAPEEATDEAPDEAPDEAADEDGEDEALVAETAEHSEPEPAMPVAGAGWMAAVAALSDEHPSEETVAEPSEPDEHVARLEPAEALDHAVRLQIRRPLDASSAASALEGDLPTEEADDASPIFGQLSSNWLNEEGETAWSDREVDRGWSAAERSEGGAEADTTRSGLPVRRPGGRLVPGGVTPESSDSVVRDPEAIRNRLAAHAAGVSRGRAAASAQPVHDDYAHEETGPA